MTDLTDIENRLLFVPLGGVGQIGMNVYLYGLNGRWMMVDLGLTFTDDRHPGADLILPDLTFIEEQKDKLDGIVITHAHEDHIGALPYLWQRLGCPVYCTGFPAAVLRRKLKDNSVQQPSAIREIPPNTDFDVGPFKCRFAHVTHSIPDANALAIQTPFGKIMHTGDWKLDPEPMLGQPTDTAYMESFGQDGVLALIADSTNVMSPGTSGSEADVRTSLIKLIAAQKGRVILTTFASNVARLETAILAGHEAGRQVAVVGRSMHRMIDAARECGYLQDIPPLLDERDAKELPRNKILYLVTGSQGEPRAALMRIAFGHHPRVSLEPGDTAIFSSKIIPGNERTLYHLHNQMVEQGIEVITEGDHFVHVSGHPCRDEIEQMYKWMRPEISIPVHGEARHLYAHAQLANKLGVNQTLVIRNGDLVQLAPGQAQVLDEVHIGRKVLETTDTVDAADDLYRARRRLMHHGTIYVSIIMDDLGSLVTAPRITTIGAIDQDSFETAQANAIARIEDIIDDLNDTEIMNDERCEQVVRTALKQTLSLPNYKRPIIKVEIIRLESKAVQGLKGAA